MKWSTVRNVFIKDGRELLRDRRTLFVNIILPVLLYPVLGMLLVQLAQLRDSGPERWPRVAVVNAPAEFTSFLAGYPEGKEPVTHSSTANSLIIVTPSTSTADLFVSAVRSHSTSSPAQSPSPSADDKGDVLQALREDRLAGVIAFKDDTSLGIFEDHADPAAAKASQYIGQAIEQWKRHTLERRLTEQGVDQEILSPPDIYREDLAPRSESIRSRAAGFIPLLLVLLAISGAFYPAVDLLAGERERGTLETLLSMPGGRREIFTGKLICVVSASVATVLLNLLSLGLTVGIVLSSSPAGGMMTDGMILDFGTLILCGVVLLPLCLTISAIALGLAGIAATTKEAMNYLAPLLLLIMVPAAGAIMPGIHSSYGMDILPVIGPVLVLKSTLQSPTIPWDHLILCLASSIAVAGVVVTWASRLLSDENFIYPGMVRAGWGRFRRWGPRPPTPGGLEALALFAISLASSSVTSVMMAGTHPALMAGVPLAFGLGVPVLVHHFLGDYSRSLSLSLVMPKAHWWLRTSLLIPLAILMSVSLGILQTPWVPADTSETQAAMEGLMKAIQDLGGIPLLLLIVAVTPGIFEELLFRGPILRGLQKSMGDGSAVVISSLLFGLMHMHPARFAPQMMMGIILAILTIRCRSMIPAMVIHAGHNGILVILIGIYGTSMDEGLSNEEAIALQSPPEITPGIQIAALLAAVIIFIGVMALMPRTKDTEKLQTPGE